MMILDVNIAIRYLDAEEYERNIRLRGRFRLMRRLKAPQTLFKKRKNIFDNFGISNQKFTVTIILKTHVIFIKFIKVSSFFADNPERVTFPDRSKFLFSTLDFVLTKMLLHFFLRNGRLCIG